MTDLQLNILAVTILTTVWFVVVGPLLHRLLLGLDNYKAAFGINLIITLAGAAAVGVVTASLWAIKQLISSGVL